MKANKSIVLLPPEIVAPDGTVFPFSQTEEAGVFSTWSGSTLNFGYGYTTYTAYVYSPDGEKIYYSNEKTGYRLTIPEAGTYQLHVCGEKPYINSYNKEIIGFCADILNCPSGKNDWLDNCDGTMQAIVSDRPLKNENPAYIGICPKISDVPSCKELTSEQQIKACLPQEYYLGSQDPTDEQKRKGMIEYLSGHGTVVREVYITPARHGKKTTIAMLADLHINIMDKEDLLNAELMLTNKTRYWGRGGSLVKAAQRGLAFADMFDKTILGGDILDIMSHGSREFVKEHIIKKYPGIMLTIASHDITRSMESGIPDAFSREQRRKYLEEAWHHNIIYHSEVVNDSVLCVVSENDLGIYERCQVEGLERDIKRARENGLTLLIFHHEPLATGNPLDTKVKCLDARCEPIKEYLDFYGLPHVGGVGRNDPSETAEYLSLIKNAPDVIKGVFAGHRHYNYYTEILAKAPDGKDTYIPQYVIKACAYSPSGCMTKIIVQ